ncbi:MAG: tetratricopeptide repeat protein [Chloroflexi bacterium]|nr:tetratricopeptide repeat protein [Chloroflexota bacterium]
MSKKKRRVERSAVGPAHPSLAPTYQTELNRAGVLLHQKRWAEARDLLDSLAQRSPERAEILTALVNANYELHDIAAYQRAAERLLKLTPDNADLTLALAGAYMVNLFPMRALRTFRRFLDRWPNHPRAASARATVSDLEARVAELLADLGFFGDEATELAVLHEEARSLLEQGEYAQARRVSEQLLQRRPDFVSALNNISQTYAIEGNLDEAIATARRALDIDSDNVHALSNLTRYLCLGGRIDEARALAERLKAVESTDPDAWLKKAEALSYLGDDEGVQQVFQQTEGAGALRPPLANPLLYHLAAVASLRLGRGDEARRRWQEALRLAPGLTVAQENLADLHEPVGKRHAPWAFGVNNWLPQRAAQDLLAQTAAAVRRGTGQAVERAFRSYLQQHPEIVRLVPLLLDRGDPAARGLALRAAMLAETREMLAALRDFALGQRGPDLMRIEAANAAADAGLISRDLMRMWQQGEWREVLLMNYEIHGEAICRHTPRIERLAAQATTALNRGDGAQAERLLKQALEVEPDAPDLFNNLAMAYEQQGRRREAEEMTRQLHERHPDYLFARTAVARKLIEKRELNAAKAMLDPLLSRRRFHVSEFGALCASEIDLWLAKGNADAARGWLKMWASVDPDHPMFAYYRQRLEPGDRWRRLLGLR